MRKKSIFWSLITLVLMFSFIMAGCTQDETEAPTEPPSVEPTEKPMQPTAKPAEPTEAVEPTEEVVTGEGPLYGGTLVIALGQSDFDTCNLAITTSPMAHENIFEGLASFDEDLQLQPELATSWDFSEDGLTLTFYLREGVKWHDGEPFTSADVKFSFEEAICLYNPRGKAACTSLDSIDTPDDYTVVFNMKNPSPGFLYQIGVGESPIIPKHLYEDEDVVEGPHATCQELPIGTGPFKALEHNYGVSFTMVRNEEWWGTEDYWMGPGMPYLDQIINLFIVDETARVNGFETGEFDFLYMEDIPAQEVERFMEMEGRLVTFECTGIPVEINFGFNLRREIWQDVRVRQAIAWALDREEMDERGYFGIGVPSPTFLPPTHPFFNPNIETYSPRDVAKAEALLDEAGYPRGNDGIRFEMDIYSFASIQDFAFVFKQQVEETGIKVNVQVPERELCRQIVYIDHEFDVNTAGLGVYDPGVGVARLFRSDNIGEGYYNNFAAYVNPEMDELWATYNTSLDEEVRKDTMYRIMELANEDLPYIFVNTPTNWASFNTEEFSGYPQDCIDVLDQMHQIWWLGGTPTR